MSDTVAYRFDGDLYPATPEGEQNLLEAISTALDTEAWTDPDLKDATDDERQEASSMAFDGTNVGMPFWDNIIAIMQHAPYEIDVKRLTREDLTDEEFEWL
jgi:hypothetical protein